MLNKVKIQENLTISKVVQASLWQKTQDLILHEKPQLLHSLPYYEQAELEKISLLYKKFSTLDCILVVGMGGAILNCKIFADFMNCDRIIFLNQLSNKYLQKLLSKFTLHKIGCVFISNGGNSLEVVAIARTILDCNIPIENIIFSYSNKDSLLAQLHREKGGNFLLYDAIMGGRFSTFTRTTQFIRGICQITDGKLELGYNRILNRFLQERVKIAHYLPGMTIVNCSYSAELQSLVHWFTSSLAESLGRDSVEILPITLQMPLDQHGLLQTLLTSKRSQIFNLFKVTKRDNYIDNTQLILENTLQSELDKASIPYRIIELSQGDCEALGEVLIYLTLEIIITAVALNLEPFTQPNIDYIKKEAEKKWRQNYNV